GQLTPSRRPRRLHHDARPEVVTRGKDDRSQSFHPSSRAGIRGGHPGSKGDGGQDRTAVRPLGPGKLFDPKPQGDRPQIRLPVLGSHARLRKLIREGRLREEELHGLADDKIASIRSYVNLWAHWDTAA